VACDIGRADQVDALFDTIAEGHGRLDHAHNNAGIEGRHAPVHAYRDDEFERVLRIHLLGVFQCVKREVASAARMAKPPSVRVAATSASWIARSPARWRVAASTAAALTATNVNGALIGVPTTSAWPRPSSPEASGQAEEVKGEDDGEYAGHRDDATGAGRRRHPPQG
jgi:NAD(P)-dependent dehydrogenase (short-subunit alcohol dehydrogenase family)